jgi:acetyl-CoA acetyltransferase
MNTLNFTKRAFSSKFGQSGKSVVIVSAKRTPIGGFMGQFKNMPAPMLGSAAARGAMESGGVSPSEI